MNSPDNDDDASSHSSESSVIVFEPFDPDADYFEREKVNPAEIVFLFNFHPLCSPESMLATLGSICTESRVPPSSQIFPALNNSSDFYFYYPEEDLSNMSWKGLNSLLSVTQVQFTNIESLLDRKNVISLLDLPNYVMVERSEVLAGLEKDIQNLQVTEKREASPQLDSINAKVDPATVKRALIVTIIKDDAKTKSEEKIREMANDSCFDTMVRDVQVVIDPDTDDHFFLLFIRPSHILDSIAQIRRGLLEGKITARKVTEATPVVQNRFLELAALPSRCFPVEIKKKETREASEKTKTDKVSAAPSTRLKGRITRDEGSVTPKSEPSTPPSGISVQRGDRGDRGGRGPTSGHIARRLVEGSLGIRSTVTREQRKKENELVASFAAEKKATRQKAIAVANQVKEAFE